MQIPDKGLTPAEFYKMRRPEYFSDSQTIYEVVLTKEHLAFELSQIAKNQKQDEFETLCRRLAEKFITPNLIPQVGPTGGGDSKVDSETYPVSEDISDRWFIPMRGWEKGEKWAFAISAKQDWRSKVRIDVAKISKTDRGYTHIYFMTNQSPSSKKKSEAQEKLKSDFKIEVTILDSEWITEKVLNNGLIELVVDSLNMSDIYKRKSKSLGHNDAQRLEKLTELEAKIANSERYTEFDFQIVEDCLDAAILSRMLEISREEVEGKFERAARFCRKVKNKKQWLRIHYQKAWTFLNWYDDYSGFVIEFNYFKNYISDQHAASDLELYVNLFNLLKGLAGSGNCDISTFGISLDEEENLLISLLTELEEDTSKLCTSLIAKTYKSILALADTLPTKAGSEVHLLDISKHLENSRGFIEFPFEHFKDIIEVYGDVFPNSSQFDILVDTIGSISEMRTSELVAGEVFLKRALQKLDAKFHKECLIYFGKSVLKLSKEESQEGMYISLLGLSSAYSSLGLIWAANNCLVCAGNLSLSTLREKGIVNRRTYECSKQLAINELLLGRIPSFLTYHELALVVANNLNDDTAEDFNMIDAFLSVRILNTKIQNDEPISMLPEVLKKQSLWLSQDTCYFMLGYVELVENLLSGLDLKNPKDIEKHFTMLRDQPFKDQLIYETNFLSDKVITISSIILGCKFNLQFKSDKELMITAEIILSYLEGFFATSLDDVFPSSETIEIEIQRNIDVNGFTFSAKPASTNEYLLQINKFDFELSKRDAFWNAIWELTTLLLGRNLFVSNFKSYLENLFKKEEIIERLTLMFEYRKFSNNLLGSKSGSTYQDWVNEKIAKYPNKRKVSFEPKAVTNNHEPTINRKRSKKAESDFTHSDRRVYSIIETSLWDAAKWRAFGFFIDKVGMSIFMVFENIEAGKQIFDNWIKKYGKEDKEGKIKVTIIKGVNYENPSWYKVHISSDLSTDLFKSTKYILSPTRFHEINAINSTNLQNLIRSFDYFKEYRFCPARLLPNQNFEPCLDKAILKKTLFIRDAWQIGLHDLDSVVIMKGDKPIIPSGVSNAPVLKVLESRN